MNSCYGGGSGQRRFKSKAYKAWEIDATLMCTKARTITEPVRADYTYFMPDRRARDLGNYEKVVSDLLVSRGIIVDDCTDHIKEVRLIYGGYDKTRPRVEIAIHVAAPSAILE